MPVTLQDNVASLIAQHGVSAVNAAVSAAAAPGAALGAKAAGSYITSRFQCTRYRRASRCTAEAGRLRPLPVILEYHCAVRNGHCMADALYIRHDESEGSYASALNRDAVILSSIPV